MFLLRSAFWLTAAWLVMAPGADGDAVARLAAAPAPDIACQTIECTAGRAAVAGAIDFALSRPGAS